VVSIAVAKSRIVFVRWVGLIVSNVLIVGIVGMMMILEIPTVFVLHLMNLWIDWKKMSNKQEPAGTFPEWDEVLKRNMIAVCDALIDKAFNKEGLCIFCNMYPLEGHKDYCIVKIAKTIKEELEK
jgi:hypothetical protein